MKALAFAVVLVGLVVLVGCGLTEQQQERMDKIVTDNMKLKDDLAKLYERAKTGQASPGEIADGVARLTHQIETNLDEIGKIRKEGATTWGIIGAVAGTFGRSVLHLGNAASGAIPGGGLLSSVLTLLLGGSQGPKKSGAPGPTS